MQRKPSISPETDSDRRSPDIMICRCLLQARHLYDDREELLAFENIDRRSPFTRRDSLRSVECGQSGEDSVHFLLKVGQVRDDAAILSTRHDEIE
jgi:hypothetical protein